MAYAVPHNGRSTTPVLANRQLAGPDRHSTGHSVSQYYTSAGKLALAVSAVDSVQTLLRAPNELRAIGQSACMHLNFRFL